MPKTVKLQKIGNSLRATIPREAVQALALRPGEEVIVDVVGDAVVLKRKPRVRELTRFYGSLRERTGEVKHWPSPAEIKGIWG